MIKCLLGPVKLPLDKLTPSLSDVEWSIPCPGSNLGSPVPWRTSQWQNTHRYKTFLSSALTAACAPSQHTHISGWKPQTPCTKTFFKMHFIPAVLSDVVMFQTVLSMHKEQHWQDTVRVSIPHFFPSATTLSTELCCTVNVENTRGRKGKLATDQ